jgi:hypothetical protein
VGGWDVYSAAFAMRKESLFGNGAFWNRHALSFQAKSHPKESVVRAEISEDRSVRLV